MFGFWPYCKNRRFLVAAFTGVGLAVAGLAVAGCQSPLNQGGVQVASPARPPATSTSAIDQPPRSHDLPPVAGPRLPTRAPAVEAPQQTAATTAVEPPKLPSFLPYLERRPEITAPQEPLRSSVPPPATSDTVRVGLLLPLSGRNAQVGRAMLNAVQLALFDFADQRLELLPNDTGGTAEGAAIAAQLAIGDGASVILGPLLARSAVAVAPAARAANVPVITFSNDRSVFGNGVYSLGFLPAAQIERVTRFAYTKGISRFAALAPDNTYGHRVVDAYRETLARLGAELVQVAFYDPYAQEFTEPVRILADYDHRRKALLEQREELEAKDDEVSKMALKRLENLQTLGDLPFDALLVADGGERLQSVAALLPFYDIDPAKVRMLGTGDWDVPGLGKEPALVGSWFAAPPPTARTDFVKQYRDLYGAPPPRLVTMAYDAAALVAVLARTEGGPNFTAAALTNPSGYWGRDGVFRFRADGASERGLAVLQVGRDKNKVISRAPNTFQAAIN